MQMIKSFLFKHLFVSPLSMKEKKKIPFTEKKITKQHLADKLALHVLPPFSNSNVDFVVSLQRFPLSPSPCLHIRGRHIQNVILHLHVNKVITDDVREYSGLSSSAQVYMNFEQPKMRVKVGVSGIFL